MIVIEQIQKRLAQELKQCGMTQTEIARQLGISQQTVSHYIKGDKLPALDTLARLCKLFDIDANYILCLTD